MLGAGELNHVIVVSLEIFAALHAGAPFGYADWAGVAAWAALGNTIGGIAFVTITRLVQVGRGGVEGSRRQGSERPRDERTEEAVSRG
jgi:hypothetical protein